MRVFPFQPGEVWRQVVEDWTGKDVQSGYTLTYTWAANELGHFAIGLGLTPVFVWTAYLIQVIFFRPGHQSLPFAPSPVLVWSIAAVHVGGWVLKEALDVRKERRQVGGSWFVIDIREVRSDAFTAVAFIGYGAGVAGFLLLQSPWSLAVVFWGLIPTVLFGWYWLPSKLSFQRANIPTQLRLSSLERGISFGNDVKRRLESFCCPKTESLTSGDPAPNADHIVIFGDCKSGKSAMAVAIATECAFNCRKTLYTTFQKFIHFTPQGSGDEPGKPVANHFVRSPFYRVWRWFRSLPNRTETAPATAALPKLVRVDGRELWHWEDVDVLVIDDVPCETVTLSGSYQGDAGSETLANELENVLVAQGPFGNLPAKNSVRTVWVVGGKGPDGSIGQSGTLNGLHKSAQNTCFLTLELEHDQTGASGHDAGRKVKAI
jgi:hypothetical protein